MSTNNWNLACSPRCFLSKLNERLGKRMIRTSLELKVARKEIDANVWAVKCKPVRPIKMHYDRHGMNCNTHSVPRWSHDSKCFGPLVGLPICGPFRPTLEPRWGQLLRQLTILLGIRKAIATLYHPPGKARKLNTLTGLLKASSKVSWKLLKLTSGRTFHRCVYWLTAQPSKPLQNKVPYTLTWAVSFVYRWDERKYKIPIYEI